MENRGIAPPGYYDDEYAKRNWTAYSWIIAMIIQYSKPGAILDIGAGCGYLVEAAMQWGLQCVGVEGSEEGVRIAKLRDPSIRIVQHKLNALLPFPDASFQTIVMYQVIEHLEPCVVENTLKEAFRVLRQGGMILVFSPSKANKKEMLADPTHINLLTPTALRMELMMCGFDDIVSIDSPLYLLGNSWVGKRLVNALHRRLRVDWLSATANARAYKK